MENKSLHFRNRNHAGETLAEILKSKIKTKSIVVAFPHGGIAVAQPIADTLNSPLELIFVKKIAAPRHPDITIGAVAEDAEPIWQNNRVHGYILEPEDLERLANKSRAAIAKEKNQWELSDLSNVKGHTVILVDDGLATSDTLISAIEFLKSKKARHIIVALPVASHAALKHIEPMVDEVIAIKIPHRFHSANQVYDDFSQTTDADVTQILSMTHRIPNARVGEPSHERSR